MRDRADVTLSDLDVDAIERVLETAPVTLGILFGSYARGENTAQSDVDVAVTFTDSLSSLDRTRARLGLIERLSDELGTDHIDVVPLTEIPQSLRSEILEDGILLVGSAAVLERTDGDSHSDEKHAEDALKAFDEALTNIEQVV